MTGNQCRDLSNSWDGLRYGALYTSMAREFGTLCRLLNCFAIYIIYINDLTGGTFSKLERLLNYMLMILNDIVCSTYEITLLRWLML